jgi:hypothetical protein
MFSTTPHPSHVVTLQDTPDGVAVHVDGKAVVLVHNNGKLVRMSIQGGAASVGFQPDTGNASLVNTN